MNDLNGGREHHYGTEHRWERIKAYVLERLANELDPSLRYHGIQHTRDDVLPAAESLAAMVELNEEQSLLLCTAAVYHDIGFIEKYDQNEITAAHIAAQTLPGFGFNASQIQIVERLIMATQLPHHPADLLEEMICDADLDSLGREDFFITSHNLWLELCAHGISLTIHQWYERQVKFLSSHVYFTASAKASRGEGKLRNIARLKQRIER